jgi:hypothetical protein
MSTGKSHVAFLMAATLWNKLKVVKAFHLGDIAVVLTLQRQEISEEVIFFKVADHLLPEYQFLGSNEALRVPKNV